MHHRLEHVAAGERLVVKTENLHDDTTIVCSCSSNSSVMVPAGAAALWWPVRGSLICFSNEVHQSIGRKEVVITDSHRPQETIVSGKSVAFGLIASQASWASILGLTKPELGAGEPAVFPAVHTLTHRNSRLLLGILKRIGSPRQEEMDRGNLTCLAMIVDELQLEFRRCIEKCPGRNAARRRSVFLRLQRTREYMRQARPDADLKSLALMANYSIWRFIRVYWSIFGETPYESLLRFRLDRAKRILESGSQCVGDVAVAVGFENRRTLTRALKRRFGVSSLSLRQAALRSG